MPALWPGRSASTQASRRRWRHATSIWSSAVPATGIAAANAGRGSWSGANPAGSVRAIAPPDAPAAVLLLADGAEGKASAPPRLVLVNASLDDPVGIPVAPLLSASGLDGAMLED